MRWLVVLMWLLPGLGLAQTRAVQPQELTLEVMVEHRESNPYQGEMILITIQGKYRRHVTLENLKQPDFDGFNWTQLGPDTWREERERGRPIKIMERRMAIYPTRAGRLEVGAFVHELTLTDEEDEWFRHDIQSEPFVIEVAPIPAQADGQWWFPTRSLRVRDQWSNPPDQLQPGDGVLRIIHLQAVGVTPEMIPPMPELTSPSAMIFAHPEKRLVELSPDGPVTHAFWRWTLRPTNDRSGVLEPLEVPYFDSTQREHRTVQISATRVAYGSVVPDGPAPIAEMPLQGRLPGWPVLALFGSVFLVVLLGSLRGWRVVGAEGLRRFAMFDPLARALARAARAGDLAQVRRVAARMGARDGMTPARRALLAQLDRAIFDPAAPGTGLPPGFARRFAKGT